MYSWYRRPRPMCYPPPGFEPLTPRLADFYPPEFMDARDRRFRHRPPMDYRPDDLDSRDDSPPEDSDEESCLSFYPQNRRPRYGFTRQERRPLRVHQIRDDFDIPSYYHNLYEEDPLYVPERPMSVSLDDIDAMNYHRGGHRNAGIYPHFYASDRERYRRMHNYHHRRRRDSPPRDRDRDRQPKVSYHQHVHYHNHNHNHKHRNQHHSSSRHGACTGGSHHCHGNAHELPCGRLHCDMYHHHHHHTPLHGMPASVLPPYGMGYGPQYHYPQQQYVRLGPYGPPLSAGLGLAHRMRVPRLPHGCLGR